LLLPLLYLYFLVPVGYELVPWLQGVTAWFAIEGLKLCGIPVYSDGLLIEVHPKPDSALSDGPQQLKPSRFANLMKTLKPLAEAVGRSL